VKNVHELAPPRAEGGWTVEASWDPTELRRRREAFVIDERV
jgi:hypothetical protein